MGAVVKRMKSWKEKLPPGKSYPIDDALKLVKEFATAKFDESVDVSVNLGVDDLHRQHQCQFSQRRGLGSGNPGANTGGRAFHSQWNGSLCRFYLAKHHELRSPVPDQMLQPAGAKGSPASQHIHGFQQAGFPRRVRTAN